MNLVTSKKSKFFLATITGIAIAVIFTVPLISVEKASAQGQGNPDAVDVSEVTLQKIIPKTGEKSDTTNIQILLKNIKDRVDFRTFTESLATGFKSGLAVFLNNLARDTAVWVASGGEGQGPLFFTEGWGPYLTRLGDQALGEFVYETGRAFNRQIAELEIGEGIHARFDDSGYDKYITNLEENKKDCFSKNATERQSCMLDARRDAIAVVALDNLTPNQQEVYNTCVTSVSPSTDPDEFDRSLLECQQLVVPDVLRGFQPTGRILFDESGGNFLANSLGAIGNSLGQLALDIAADVCAPSSVDVALKISLSLDEDATRARCSFSTIKRNFERNVIDPLFAQNFLPYFQTNSNDIGIALTLWDKQLEEKLKTELEGLYERNTNQGVKDLKENVTGNIKTPSVFIGQLFGKSIDDSSKLETTFTGTIADAFDIFVNTLAGELLDKIGRRGLADGGGNSSTRFPGLKIGSESLTSFTSSPGTAGIAGAELRFADFTNVRFSGGGQFEILNLLTQCPDPRNPGPTECVISNKFRSAVQEKLTLREAIEQGAIDGDLPLGFRGDGTTLAFNESYPYRSLIILRKYRIIPVGWELAALYIKNFGKETKTLREVMSEYDNTASPFYRLVDPHWVLKSPENFCRAEGPGPVIIDERISSGTDADDDGNFLGINDTPPEITVARDKSYCADERSCLSENPDGSCKYFGYCTKDKPKWNFQGESCDQNYNTCTSFQTPEGTSVAYLENTVDFSTCNADNAGCRLYCEDRNPETGDWLCTETAGSRIHFDRDVEECPAGADGCRRYLSLTKNSGVNLIANSSLEDFNGEVNAGVGSFLMPEGSVNGHSATSEEFIIGDISAELTSNVPFAITVDTGRPLRGRTFTFSLFTNNCSDSATFGFNHPQAAPGTITGNGATWQRQSITYTYRTGAQPEAELFITDSGSACTIDGLMLEEGDFVSPYLDYQNNISEFIKTAPKTYDCSTTNPNRASLCNNYTLMCTAEEVGCALYTPVAGGEPIPAVTTDGDFCAAECVGYDAFKQQATFFENSVFPEYVIPSTARSCSAPDAGCDEFTNLDQLARGGESRESYKYLRQCVKPQSPGGASCETFFTWVGTEETGYQLITENLQRDGSGAPALVVPDTLLDTLNLGECDSADDAVSNPECREYFDTSASAHYVFWRLTRSCTENCIPLRKAEANQSDCEDSGGDFNPTENTCTYSAVLEESAQCSLGVAGCRAYTGNAGNNIRNVFTDDLEDGAVDGYVAGEISNESIQPAGHSIVSDAAVTGTGNEIVTSPGFVSGTFVPGRTYEVSFWAKASSNLAKVLLETVGGDAFVFTDESAIPNDVNIGTQWNKYTIGPFVYDPTGVADPSALQVRFVAWDVTSGNLPGGTARRFFMDNITITVVRDNIYQIKNSWNTPLACDNLIDDPFGSACAASGVCDGTAESPCRCSGPGVTGGSFTSETPFQLGCQAYTGPDGQVTLSSFTNICKLEAVGCEAMIDTHNSRIPYDQVNNAVCRVVNTNPSLTQFVPCTPPGFSDPVCTTNENGECFYDLIHSDSIREATGTDPIINVGSTVVTPADDVVYIVNNSEYYCAESEAGCTALGSPRNNTTAGRDFRTTYLINSPDTYGRILCDGEEVWCEEYRADSGFVYFKDPRGNVCEFRTGTGLAGEKKWFKKKVNPSDTDELCQTTTTKTLGIGAVLVETPIGECLGGTNAGSGCTRNSDCSGGGKCQLLAAMCPIAQNSCKEYVDPLSSFAPSVLFNGSFEQNLDGNADVPDAWINSNGALQPANYNGDTVKADVDYSAGVLLSQTLGLEPNTLYTVSFTVQQDDIDGNAVVGVEEVNGFSTLISPDNSMRAVSGNRIELEISHAALTNAEREYSGRFETGSGNAYTIYVGTRGATNGGHLINGVLIKKTGIFYQFEEQIDKTSCNGVVDPEAGCVLFNERQPVGGSRGTRFTTLTFDADASGADNFNSASTECVNTSLPTTLCDSNVLVSVRPDRQCAEWLTCRSSVQDISVTGEVTDRCVDIALCSAFDPDTGVCTQIVPRTIESQNINLTLNKPGGPYSIDLASHLTGYSKTGIQYNGSADLVEGLLPFDVMVQKGELVNVINGDFEEYSQEGQPLGWFVEGGAQEWSSDKFRVIRDPFTAEQILGSQYNKAPVGRSFLQVGSTFTATSEYIEVSGNTPYTISGFINTLGLESGDAEVAIEEYDSGGVIGTLSFSNRARSVTLPYLEFGNPWQLRLGQFITDPTTQRIRIRLQASEGVNAIGTFFFDDISLRPGLKMQGSLNTLLTPEEYARRSQYCEAGGLGEDCFQVQECRLYPQDDALSCKYFDENGLRVSGWPGYCIEHDPSNPDACISWWPVDRILGEGLDEQKASYSDRFPLYMCVNAKPPVPPERGTVNVPQNRTWAQGIGCTNDSDVNEMPIITVINGASKIIARPQDVTNIIGYSNRHPTSSIDYIAPKDDYEGYCVVDGIGGEGTVSPKWGGGASPCVADGNGRCGGIPFTTNLSPRAFEISGIPCIRDAECAADPGPEDRCVQVWYGHTNEANNGEQGQLAEWMVFRDTGGPGAGEMWFEWYGADTTPGCDQPDQNGRVEIDVVNSSQICTDIAQVVTPSAAHTAWTGRVFTGSSYAVPNLNYQLLSDFQPFGGAVPPKPVGVPGGWDAQSSVCVDPSVPWVTSGQQCSSSDDCAGVFSQCGFTGNNPLTVEAPDRANLPDPPHQVRAGSPYSCSGGAACPIGTCLGSLDICRADVECENTNICCTPGRPGCSAQPPPLSFVNSTTIDEGISFIKRIFARSYGTWEWTGNQYSSSNRGWSPPDQICPSGGRPLFAVGTDADLCGTPPFVSNVSLSAPVGSTGVPSIDNTGFTTLSFNTDLDPNQLPLTRLKVDWGDNQTSVISGVGIRERTNPEFPHRFFHLYSYWDLVGKDDGVTSITCDAPGDSRGYPYCEVQIRIQAKDNWGWCNAIPAVRGLHGDQCDTNPDAWTDIIVLEVTQ